MIGPGAQEQVALALPLLSGAAWSKVRGLLQATESFPFLDQLHNQLCQLSVPEELCAALVRLWWLRRQRPRSFGPDCGGGLSPGGPVGAAGPLPEDRPELVRQFYRQVAAVFGRAMRASSAVECMNSVLRMHQTRHKTLSQGMLDLKRLD